MASTTSIVDAKSDEMSYEFGYANTPVLRFAGDGVIIIGSSKAYKRLVQSVPAVMEECVSTR